MTRFIRRIVIFLFPFLIGIILLFSMKMDDEFKYRFVKGECDNKAHWIYHRIYKDKRPVDIAFTGASQIGSALIDEIVEQRLSDESAGPVEAANFGYCRRGRDIQYIMLRDLFQHKNPEVLVVEVYEDEPKKSHPVFPYLAETGELFNSCIVFNQRFPASVFKNIAVRFEYIKFSLFHLKYKEEYYFQNYGYRPSQEVASSDIIEQNERNWQNRLNKTTAPVLREIELNYSKHYLEKIVDLAHGHDCQVLFLYLPESGSHLKKPLLDKYYNQLADVVYLPDNLIGNRSYWKDATHFNDQGAEQVSELVVSKLKEMF